MVRSVEVDPERFRAVAQLLSDHPDLDVEKVRGLLEAPTGRRRRADPIRPRSWAEVTSAVEAGWITKNEARKLAGLTQRRGPTRRPRGEE